jgi:hypothetical protein
LNNYTELIGKMRLIGGNCAVAADAIEALVAERDALRTGLSTLLHQIEINDFVDSHGHSAKMLSAVLDAKKLLEVKNG